MAQPPQRLASPSLKRWVSRSAVATSKSYQCPKATDQDDDDLPPIYYPDISAAMDLIEESRREAAEEDEPMTSQPVEAVWQASSSYMDDPSPVHLTLPSQLSPCDTESDTHASVLERSATSHASSTWRPGTHTRSIHTLARHTYVGRRCFSCGHHVQAIHASPYELLGLPKSASTSDIKAKYYEHVKTLHPDAIVAEISESEKTQRLEKFRAVVKAYELLKDPKKRSLYDKYAAGWDYGSPTQPSTAWQGRGQFRPRTADEWEHWHMWSEVLRRAAHQGHHAPWQRMAQHNSTSSNFYGFHNVSPDEAKRRQEEAAPWNQRIFLLLIVSGMILAGVQIEGIKMYSTHDSSLAAQHTTMVANNLEQARRAARSEEGRLRQQLMLERAREKKRMRDTEETLST
ncbi:hypothetical protein Malapachy_2939 [Malassezia pachydermatis]|uniref:J domain-containing protein n=1 Tax=Malassezia pachydermatis TaxID=77020 RepID=A0A0M8MQA3_9BASI|nr:hypothetical protein Malapachy_2939 [Malassezia pachydermatis]KOS16178.1 hypothetical protein Malapachy_2939 [Malassezia pachydermatis]